MAEVRTYVFKDLNAVANGVEAPQETDASKARREDTQPVLRRRWRQEKPDALHHQHD